MRSGTGIPARHSCRAESTPARGGVRRPDRRGRTAAGPRRPAAAAVALVLPAGSSRPSRDRCGRPSRRRAVPAPDPGAPPDVRRRAAAPGRAHPGGRGAVEPFGCHQGRGQIGAQRRSRVRDRAARTGGRQRPGRHRGAGHRYRSEPEGAAPRPVSRRPGAFPPRRAEREWRAELATDPVLLFRFSALTYNGHRIHYDRPYATQAEGYPDLVLHGPLLALLALELPRINAPGRLVRSFGYRLTRPRSCPPG